jgi:mono/diheme cytochrome c family protein
VQYCPDEVDLSATLRGVRHRLRPLLVVLVALLAIPLAACGGDDAPEGAGGAPDGQAIYESNCARCHGPDDEGGVGLPLGNGAVEESLTLDEQIETITNGRDAMPAWGDQLSDEEIEAVATYEREELGR